jgi:hypothetical protein
MNDLLISTLWNFMWFCRSDMPFPLLYLYKKYLGFGIGRADLNLISAGY